MSSNTSTSQKWEIAMPQPEVQKILHLSRVCHLEMGVAADVFQAACRQKLRRDGHCDLAGHQDFVEILNLCVELGPISSPPWLADFS